LSGHSAQWMADANRPVPVWAWVNALAHGSDDDITALASGDPPSAHDQSASVWQQALAFLAQELTSQATRPGCSLADIQRSTLVPLELELAGRQASGAGEPAQLVARVLSALARHPTSRHR